MDTEVVERRKKIENASLLPSFRKINVYSAVGYAYCDKITKPGGEVKVERRG